MKLITEIQDLMVVKSRLGTEGLVLRVEVICFGLAPDFSSSSIKSLNDVTTALTGGLPLEKEINHCDPLHC